MSRLNALADRTTGQSFGLTNYQNCEADVNYLAIGGANLASAATVAITNEFHIVTGTTTIDNINDALGAIAGQQVRLLFQSSLVFRNNGGGTGNIRTASGSDRRTYANEIVTFTYDGTTWREGELAPGVYKIWDSVEEGVSLPAASITTPTIPGTFKSLLVEIAAAGSVAANNVALNMRCNGDTSGDYYWLGFFNNAGTLSSLNGMAASGIFLSDIPAASFGGRFGGVRVVLQGYRDALQYKPVITSGAALGNTNATSDAYEGRAHWYSGAGNAAITSLTFYPSTGNIIAGSRITLYGEV